MTYLCATCGQLHDDLPNLASDYPYIYQDIPENERARRTQLTTETCIVDGVDYFIRGVIELPIHDYAHPFGFGVWISQKDENFFAYQKHPKSAELGPFFGWLATRLSYYPIDTLALKGLAHFSGRGQRPLIELQPTDHPLAVDQREGITLDKAWQIVHWYQDLVPSEPSNERKRPWWKVWG